MSLLEEALEAHGGEDAWSRATKIRAHIRSGGFALGSKLARRRFRDYVVRVTVASPRVEFDPYPRTGRRGVFEGGRVRMESADGEVLAERGDPRPEFRRPRRLVYWDPLDSLYFAGYALWNYLTTPLLLTRPGIEAREGEPWEERRGQTWRRLEVDFPADLPTHSPHQTFYFDESGVLRRQDYTAEPFGSWARAANYSFDHREFDGLLFPTRRRVVPRARSNRPRRGPTLVWIELDSIEVSSR